MIRPPLDRVLRWIALGLAMLAASACAAPPEEDDDRPQVRPGVVAEFTGSDRKSHRRVDELVSFDWGEAAPDPRIPLGVYSVTWRGRLFSIAPGEYQLRVFATGTVKITLAGQVLLDRQSDTPQWLSAAPIKLAYGHHPLEIQYRRTGKVAQIGLFWQGPKFALEPVPAWHLFHDPPTAPPRSFAEGERLAHALRCAACHGSAAAARPLPAAALARLAGNVDRSWLVHWIQYAGHGGAKTPGKSPQGASIASRMPDFGLSREEAEAVAACLTAHSEQAPPPVSDPPSHRPGDEGHSPEKTKLPGPKAKKSPAAPKASPEVRGRELLVTLGCLACHQVESLGREANLGAGLFGGGDLSRIADKRPAAFFARWLADPAVLNADHRMPVFPLSEEERADLAAYLGTLKSKDALHGTPPSEANEALIARGKELLARHNCQACHRLPSDRQAPAPAPRLGTESRWDDGCLAEPAVTKRRPGYRLPTSARAALREYYETLAPSGRDAAPSKVGDGNRLSHQFSPDLILAERNCLGCHARGNTDGLAWLLPQVVAAHPALSPALTALKPPALHGVGDKLHEHALREAILTKRTGNAPLRPWLRIRMPKFDLADEEAAALVKHFVDTDRIPAGSLANAAGGKPIRGTISATESAAMRLAGSRLVTSEGFGCTSCHPIGRAQSEKDEIRSLGPDLKLLGRRLRREWYDRWMPNPARIVPNMEMPSLVAPIRGVLNDRLDDQLAAVWHVLQQADFEPPTPGAIRVVRCRNAPSDTKAGAKVSDGERAHVITDVFRVGDKVFVKPLVIGLPNRHNILFDLETNQLAAWWIGDTARQYTRGKSWHWEAGDSHFFLANDKESELLWHDATGKAQPPLPRGQSLTELDALEWIDGGVRFSYRLQLKEAAAAEDPWLHVTQTFTALVEDRQVQNPAAQTGFTRRVDVRRRRVALEFRTLPVVSGHGVTGPPIPRWRVNRAGETQPFGEAARAGIDFRGPAFQVTAGRALAGGDGDVQWSARYVTAIPVDSILAEPSTPPIPPSEKLRVVPGYEAVRLPLPEEMMPTGLAWRPDGSLVISDLKGRVLTARDTDGDDLEDHADVLADGLAAPYGVAARDGAVDVITKYALLRLHSTGPDKAANRDGRAQRIETLASGWGHTDDYHDWAVGLPRDTAGNYYLALPCQQDDRGAPAAHLRGKALKLIPRQPSGDDPRRFAIQEICSGLRFPMGLALSRDGALFASDNQGNYNPFNELNHLRPDAHYGFINKLDFRPGVRPALTPPAINIPHPWTRSVNGICFLDTPPAVRAKLGRNVFGPFEGQLIGCEYDTRRLIRFSLHKVGDAYQGAAYDFTHDAAGGDQLAGPVCCAVSPSGDLVVGKLRDSGWGGGANVGSIVRLRPAGKLPLGIAEVRATRDGFAIEFTGPVDRAAASRPENYAVASYRRESTPAYGGPDLERRTETIRSVELAADPRRVQLKLGKWREGFVYEIRLNLAAQGEQFHPAEAHYTLRTAP